MNYSSDEDQFPPTQNLEQGDVIEERFQRKP
jgi:hypothetical protein